MAINLGDAIITIKGDTKKLDNSLAGTTKRIGKSFMIAGAVVGAAIGGIIALTTKMIGSYADAGDQIDKMSKRTGMAAESLSELKHATELSGTSLEAVEKGAKRMAKTIEDAKDGLSTAVRAFDKLGITLEELEGMTPDQAFNRLTLAIAAVEDPLQRAAIAQDVFGRAGTQLLPMLSEGAEGLAAMRAEAHELGLVFTGEGAAAAAEYNDNILRLKKSFQGLWFSIAKTLMPVLNELLVQIKPLVIEFRKWFEENALGKIDIDEIIKSVRQLFVDVHALADSIERVFQATMRWWDILAKLRGAILSHIQGPLRQLQYAYNLMAGRSWFPEALENMNRAVRVWEHQMYRSFTRALETVRHFETNATEIMWGSMGFADENVERIMGSGRTQWLPTGGRHQKGLGDVEVLGGTVSNVTVNMGGITIGGGGNVEETALELGQALREEFRGMGLQVT